MLAAETLGKVHGQTLQHRVGWRKVAVAIGDRE